jgi:hypothetical protein
VLSNFIVPEENTESLKSSNITENLKHFKILAGTIAGYADDFAFKQF